jgi:hypothetical protein
MTITAESMADKMLTLSQIEHELATTEPLEAKVFSGDNKVAFKLSPDWNADLNAVVGTAPVGAYLTIDGTEYQLSKDAVLQAAANVGLTAAYLRKSPAALIAPHLNYWYSSAGIGQDAYSTLQVKNTVQAVTKSGHVPFSNLSLLEIVVDGIYQKYGMDTAIMADYKFSHTLRKTDVRLVVPETSRIISKTGVDDDRWSAGVHLSNSIIGKSMTSVEAYLFRWWCTNGAITEFDGTGTWNRRLNGQEEMDVWDWARTSVDDVLSGMETRFDEVQALTSLAIDGNLVDVTKEVFETYGIPQRYRMSITEALTSDPGTQLTMYSVMQAVTQVANQHDTKADHVEQMMRVGGSIPTAHFSPLKARIYEEGQQNPTAPNPYAIPSAV